MLKERTKKQLLLPLFLLQELCDSKEDYVSIRIYKYLEAIINKNSDDKIKKSLYNLRDRFYYNIAGLELKKPPVTRNHEILKKFYIEHYQTKQKAKDCKYSGYKVLLTLYYYSQEILLHYEANEILPKLEELKLIKYIKKSLDYALHHEHSERFKRLNSDEDFEKLNQSAQKQAKKYFNKYYINI